MKKFTVIGMAIIFSLFSFTSCGKGPSGPKTGAAKAEDVLKLLPEGSKAVFLVDLHRVMSIETVDKAIKDNKDYNKYLEFVEKSGINPQKDLYYIAAALTSDLEKDRKEGVGILNLKYNKDTLLTFLKEKMEEKEAESLEEEYNGMTIYTSQQKDKNEGFVFLDDSNIVIGTKENIKDAIDVYQKKKRNIFKNEALSALIAKANKNALVWGVVQFTPDAVSKATSGNPMLSNLESVNALTVYFDYLNKDIIAEIKIMLSDATKNNQIVDLLNGFKAMGAMGATEKPEIGELLNKIEITSGPDHVKIYASLPEELMNKLKEKKTAEEEDE